MPRVNVLYRLAEPGHLIARGSGGGLPTCRVGACTEARLACEFCETGRTTMGKYSDARMRTSDFPAVPARSQEPIDRRFGRRLPLHRLNSSRHRLRWHL
jgi:hypothetical protein